MTEPTDADRMMATTLRMLSWMLSLCAVGLVVWLTTICIQAGGLSRRVTVLEEEVRQLRAQIPAEAPGGR